VLQTRKQLAELGDDSLADLAAIALNNFLKSEKYWARQRCEGAAGGGQQAFARSYLHEAGDHWSSRKLQSVQTMFPSRALTDCGFENASAECGLSLFDS
jgi:hypothetical protein